MKRRLVFHFSVFNGVLENRAIKIHLKCLKKYSNVFTEALFILSVSEDASGDDIASVEKAIVDCGFVSNVKFLIEKITPYYEAKTFYYNIAQNLENLDGITFFGHTKGTTNYGNPRFSSEAIDAWIVGLYFLSLDDIKDVEYNLVNRFNNEPSLFYGSCPIVWDREAEFYSDVFYAGTFYWINGPLVKHYLIEQKKDVPMIDSRFYAEKFPSFVSKWENGNKIYSYQTKILYSFDPYNEMHNMIPFLCDNKFDKFNSLLSDIKPEIDQ